MTRRTPGSRSASTPTPTPNSVTSTSRPPADFTTSAAQNALQHPDKINRLIKGFEHLELQKYLPPHMIAIMPPDSNVITLSEASPPRKRVLHGTINDHGPEPSSSPFTWGTRRAEPSELDQQLSAQSWPAPTESQVEGSALEESQKGKKKKNKKKKKSKKSKSQSDPLQDEDDEDMQMQVDDQEAVEEQLNEVDTKEEGSGLSSENEGRAVITTYTPHSSISTQTHEHHSQVADEPLPFHLSKRYQQIAAHFPQSQVDEAEEATQVDHDSSEEEIGELVTPNPDSTDIFVNLPTSASSRPTSNLPIMIDPASPPTPLFEYKTVPTINILTPSPSRFPTPPSDAEDQPHPHLSSANIITPIHPLSKPWTLYYSDTSDKGRLPRKSSMSILAMANHNSLDSPGSGDNEKKGDYSSGIIPIFTSSTVEDLLGSWKALRRAIAKVKGRTIEPEGTPLIPLSGGLGIHMMPDDTNFHLFVDGVKPMWEDSRCAKGGKLMITTDTTASMDHTFLELCLLVVGGTIDDLCPVSSPTSKSMICGVAISRRKLTRIEIWLGGDSNLPPETEWIESITSFLQDHFTRSGGFKVYGYKSFGTVTQHR